MVRVTFGCYDGPVIYENQKFGFDDTALLRCTGMRVGGSEPEWPKEKR